MGREVNLAPNILRGFYEKTLWGMCSGSNMPVMWYSQCPLNLPRHIKEEEQSLIHHQEAS